MRYSVLDQQDLPACVGFGWCHWLLADPMRQYLDPVGIYRAAQYCDEWEGNDYDGTSVRAGAKVLRNFGLIGEFRATQDLDVLTSVLLESGPVCVGTNWYARMDNPDPGGYLHARGRLLGGHAWLLVGCDIRKERLTMLNSWGSSWGTNGRAFVNFADMDRLLSEDGECWIGQELHPVTWTHSRVQR